MSLAELGWNEHFARALAGREADGLAPARITAREKERWLAHDGTAELTCALAGRLRREAEQSGGFPAAGDWVAVRPLDRARAAIHELLPRRTRLSRKVPGAWTEEQVIAANIDTVFIVAGLDRDFNPRRVERYVTAARAGGAAPVIVLNKTDLCPDPAAAADGLGALAAGIAVHPVSALADTGLDALRPYARAGETVAFVGSSGVGKSSLINRLLGVERQATGEISRAVGKGRHITTRRELIPIPGGGLLVDTPGLRELQLWGGGDDLEAAFEDIEALARRCRFRDCRHEDEPGCAVRAAVEAGELELERLRNYEKLRRELKFLARRQTWSKMKKHTPRPPGPG
ncbi:MAG: ribosome small subunit-dependent GTPase A [bacterium]